MNHQFTLWVHFSFKIHNSEQNRYISHVLRHVLRDRRNLSIELPIIAIEFTVPIPSIFLAHFPQRIMLGRHNKHSYYFLSSVYGFFRTLACLSARFGRSGHQIQHSKSSPDQPGKAGQGQARQGQAGL